MKNNQLVKYLLLLLAAPSFVSSCENSLEKACVKTDSPAVLEKVLALLEGPLTQTYGGPKSNYSFSHFVNTSDISLIDCSGIIQVTFTPATTQDGVTYLGPIMVYKLNLEKKKILDEKWVW